MNLSSSPEFFINMRSIPDRDSPEYHPFFQNELDKIKYGVTVNGVYIHGWLYWHLNHWHLIKDVVDPRNPKDTIRKLGRPDLRDNEWLIMEHLIQAEEQKKGLLLFGSRRLGKTMFEASWIGRAATIYEDSENVLAGTNEADIKLIAAAIDKGLTNVHEYFRFEKLKDDWRKEVALGYKPKKRGGAPMDWSRILVRNLDEGKNTEAIAGTTPKTLVIDEVGKHEWLEAFTAAIPGFTSEYGWRCIPIATGTGGTFEANSDAEKVFKNPDSYNFLAKEWPGKERKYGVFIPGSYRMEGKVESTFGKFIETKSGILIPEDSELSTLYMKVSDVEKAKAKTNEELEQFKQAHDPKAALKIRMYFPNDPDDCFLNAEVNNFPIEAIEQHLKYLDELEVTQGFVGQSIELYRDATGKVCFTTSTKLKEIKDFPVTAATIKDAPILMYEPPVDNPAPLLYIAGSDPYNQNTSDSSPSLGTVYIYKRLYDPVSGTFQNSIVASWAARPRLMKDWHKTVEMLLEFYGATCMAENEGTNFIEYMSGKNKDYMLADGYNLVQQVSPGTTIKNRPKGLPATPRVIRHCMQLAYDYCNEELDGIGTDGKPIRKLGVTRIMDRILLTEMLNYTQDGNFDRIVAFRHALAYDNYLQKISPLVRFSDTPEPVVRQVRHIPHSPFRGTMNKPFSGMNNPFRLR